MDDPFKENHNEDQFAKETDPNLPNEDQFAKEPNPNLPNSDNFMSDALLFRNDEPLNGTKEERETNQSFLGESTVSDAFEELYNSDGALEGAYEEMRNELMGDFDMHFNNNNNNNNDDDDDDDDDDNIMCEKENIYVDQEADLLGETKIGTGTGTRNDMPCPEETLNNNNNDDDNNNSSFENEKPEFPSEKDEENQEIDISEGRKDGEIISFENEKEKLPTNGDLRDENEEVVLMHKPQNNDIICEIIYTDQEANLLNAPKIANETLSDAPSQEKTLNNNKGDQKNEDRIKNNDEDEQQEIDIMDSNENGSQNDEKSKEPSLNENNIYKNTDKEEEEELVDIMDTNENVKSPSFDEGDRYEDALELQIPQAVQALNAGPSPPKRKVRKRSRSKSKSRSREKERQRGKSRRRSVTRDRRRERSRSPISLRDLRRGGSPRIRSPRRRRRSPPPPRSLRRRSPPPVRRRRPPSPVRRSTGFGRPGKNLYVTGFSFDTTVDDLESKFSKYGTVSGTRIVRDRLGDSKGFGFLSMDTDLEADEAIRALDGKVWNNKILVVEKTKSSQRI